MATEGLDIVNRTKSKLPRLPFLAMKDFVLGKSYNLSFAIVGSDEMRKLNKLYRGKDKVTDILSFPLSLQEGEIFINPQTARAQAKQFDRTYSNFIGFLFIHGLLHLKGMTHGSTMEREEKKVREKFGI